jgi:glycosyltransferase involved in cell wall biosynthesis
MSEKTKISIIIPTYKKAKTIRLDLHAMQEVFESLRFDYEMIIVIDGKLDKSWEEAEKFREEAEHKSKIKILGYEKNHGKGHAVRYGMKKATGEYVAFMDADRDINPNNISMLLEHMQWYDADIIVASKRHPVSKVHYPFIRRVYSWGYQTLTRTLFGLNVKDTQTGMKVFKKEVLETIMPRLLIKTWAFDIEMLSVAHYCGYTKIFEAPVELDHQFNSAINRNVVFKMLWDTCAVFYRMHLLKYYDDRNKDHWLTSNTID